MERRRRKMHLLRVNVLETLTFGILISEKTYRQMKKDLKKQVAETRSDPERESTFVAEDTEIVEEFDTNINRIYRATLGTTDIELEETACNPGYHFRKK